MARKGKAQEIAEPGIDAFLLPGIENRMAAIRAVADGLLPVECVSINICWVRRWANNVNQPEGRIHGFEIKKRERGKING